MKNAIGIIIFFGFTNKKWGNIIDKYEKQKVIN